MTNSGMGEIERLVAVLCISGLDFLRPPPRACHPFPWPYPTGIKSLQECADKNRVNTATLLAFVKTHDLRATSHEPILLQLPRQQQVLREPSAVQYVKVKCGCPATGNVQNLRPRC